MLNIYRFRQKGDRRDKRFKRDIRGHDGVDWNLNSIKINIPFSIENMIQKPFYNGK